MKKQQKKNASANKRPISVWRVLRWMLVAGIWALFLLGGLVAWWATDLPDFRHVENPARRPPVSVLAADGSVVLRIGGQEGKIVNARELPPHLIHAVLAIEDRRFYEHGGIDPLGLARAAAANLMAGGVVQGGSTITQQLAKNLFLSAERSLKRKGQEAILALWLEHTYSKDQILTAYLNEVYFGSGAYGVDAAAHTYFGKSARDVGLVEAAALAGMLKAPSSYSPTDSPYRAAGRTKLVLSAMVDAGYISRDDVEALNLQPPPPRRKPLIGDSVRYFSDWVLTQVAALGLPEGQGLVVKTTLVPDIQRAAEREIDSLVGEDGKKYSISQAAAVVMTHDGAVQAMVGGADYRASQFNRITQAQRQPGSAFKPVIFLAALEGGMTPDTMVEDAPVSINGWKPENFDKTYLGMISLSEALALSVNTAAVRVLAQAGLSSAHEMARRLGITATLADDLSLALGSSAVSPIELASAYASIANGGIAVWPYGITEVTDLSGRVLYQKREPVPLQVVEPELTATLRQMMAGVVDYGTGTAAQIEGRAVAGKTGTSQGFRDAWFAGFDAGHVALVWMGNDDNKPMKGVAGGGLPARLWRGIMAEVPPPTAGFPASFLPTEATPLSPGESGGFGSMILNLIGQ